MKNGAGQSLFKTVKKKTHFGFCFKSKSNSNRELKWLTTRNYKKERKNKSTHFQNQIWCQLHPRVPVDAFFIALCVKICFFLLFLKSLSQVKNSFNWVQRIQRTAPFKSIVEIKSRHSLLTITSLKMIEVALLSTEELGNLCNAS